jgi:dihydroxyacetone kinase
MVYAPEANADARTIQELANEIERLRATTIDLFRSFTPAMLQRTGTANKAELSVLNLGYIIAGHESHHRKILKERYL